MAGRVSKLSHSLPKEPTYADIKEWFLRPHGRPRDPVPDGEVAGHFKEVGNMSRINKTSAGIMLAALVAGGGIGAVTLPAIADSGSSSSSSASPSAGSGAASGTGATSGTGQGTHGPHQANGKTEEILTGDTAAKVEAAVKAAQPDATIERMETDADGATYEAHITKADGTHATVLLDENFTVTGTETQGQGGGRGGHGPGDNDGDADDSGGNTASPSPSATGSSS
jgi:hypothetical protein